MADYTCPDTTEANLRAEVKRLRSECDALFDASETLSVHLCIELGIPYETADDSLICGAVRRLLDRFETLAAKQTALHEGLRLYKASYENREKGREYLAVHDAFRRQLFAALESHSEASDA